MRKALFFLAAGLCGALLFAGGSGRFSLASFRHAWDFGHVICFALWGRGLLDYRRRGGEPAFWPAVVAVLVFALVVGGGVELLQGAFGRDPDLGDLGRDLVGALVALAFFPWNPQLKRRWVFGLKALAVGLTLFCLYPAAYSFTDETFARRNFPVLSDFETPFELDRWEGSSRRSIVGDLSAHGRSALRIELVPGKYSGVILRHPVSDWRGYAAVAFSVFNPSGRPMTLHCRIEDRHHRKSGYRYRDRFNRSFVAEPGWSEVSFAMDEVTRAPEGRPMLLDKISRFSLFAKDVERAEVFYFDHLRLVPREQAGG